MKKTFACLLTIAVSGCATGPMRDLQATMLQLHSKDSPQPTIQIDQPSNLVCELWALYYTKTEQNSDTKWSCSRVSYAKGLPVEMTMFYANQPIKAHFDSLDACMSYTMPFENIQVLKACEAKPHPASI